MEYKHQYKALVLLTNQRWAELTFWAQNKEHAHLLLRQRVSDLIRIYSIIRLK